MKKSKFWEPFWSYQLDSSANPAHLPKKWAKSELEHFPGIDLNTNCLDYEYKKYVKNMARG